MFDDTYKRLFAILADGQWNGVGPKPTIAARIDAQKAYDALQLLEPQVLRPRRGWRTFVWRLVAALRG